MPKSPTSPSDPVSRMTDVALRKKKNADAQAAFRARRANYIATLETSVNNLERVIVDMQDSLHDSAKEIADLRKVISQWEEHQKYCPQARKHGELLDGKETLPSPFSGNSQVASSHSTPLLQHPFNGLHFQEDGSTTYNNSPASHGQNFSASPASFSNNDPDATGSSLQLHRAGGKYGAPYSYPMQGSSRDMRNGWQVPPVLNRALHGGDAVTAGPHSQPPAYVNSPSIASVNEQMSEFPGRFGGDDSKSNSASVLDSAPCVFPDDGHYMDHDQSRSMSPNSSSAPNSSTAIPMTSSFAPFPFHEDRGQFDYRRQPQCPQVMVHGGTTNVSHHMQHVNDMQYRLSGRRDGLHPEHRQIVSNENDIQQHLPQNDGDLVMDDLRLRARLNTASSRSPSPGRPSISCTVAVIRAQSFGALRRTRASTKKSTEAARITMNVLQSRGIGMRDSVISPKQPLLDSADGHHSANTP